MSYAFFVPPNFPSCEEFDSITYCCCKNKINSILISSSNNLFGVSGACFSAFKGREIGNEKLIGILDLQQISYKNIDPRGLITGFQLLQVNTFGS